MASTETKAIHVVPVQSKGTVNLKQITEVVIWFSLENSARCPWTVQAGSEQILRSAQKVRKVLDLDTEIRLTGAAQNHAPEVSAEELAVLDHETRKKEIERALAIVTMKESEEQEVEMTGGTVFNPQMQARVGMAQAFATTSLMIIPSSWFI